MSETDFSSSEYLCLRVRCRPALDCRVIVRDSITGIQTNQMGEVTVGIRRAVSIDFPLYKGSKSLEHDTHEGEACLVTGPKIRYEYLCLFLPALL